MKIYDSATVPYQSLDDFSIKYDIIRTHEEFHGHKCTDSVLVQQRDGSHNLGYAKLLLMFKISVSGEEHDIVFIQDYAVASPADMSEDDKATGFRKLILGGLVSQFMTPDRVTDHVTGQVTFHRPFTCLFMFVYVCLHMFGHLTFLGNCI